jgi:hypothetical protein
MLQNVVRELHALGKSPQIVNIPYTAQYGVAGRGGILGESFNDSLKGGRTLLRAEIAKGPCVVLGYSAGAKLAGDVAAEKPVNLLACGLIADPAMPCTAKNYNHYGITGSRPVTTVPTTWKADPKDGICQCPRNSPLRTLADQSEAFSLGDPVAWTGDLWSRFVQGRWQPTNVWAQVGDARWPEADRLFYGYLLGGDHTSYGCRREANNKTYTRNLAEWIAPWL